MAKIKILIFGFILSSCSHIVVQREDGSVPASVKSYELESYLWAFLPGRQLPPEAELCPNARIETLDLRMDGSDVLTTAVTIGLYVPHHVIVGCSKPLPSSAGLKN